MPQMSKNGITTETTQNFMIDVGAVYKNYDEDGERLLGATRDGATFAVETDYREIEIDGRRGPLKGGRRIIEVRPQMTVNLLEVTKDNLMLALTGSDSESNTNHDIIHRNRDIQLSDYVDNIALVGTMSGTDTPIILIVKNAIADNEITLDTSDRDETTLEVVFTGHFDPDDLDDEPWEIRYPNGSAA